MQFKKNIIAGFISQLYVTAVGILMLPLYINYMGAEAYGLVGFFSQLQIWFQLLDIGLTSTMARESARHQGGASTALEYRRLARALEGVFLCMALLGGIFLFAMASPMASGWLVASEIPGHEIAKSLQLIALIVAIRWMCGLYRGVITGAERLVWLGVFNSLVATGRFVLVLPLLIFVSPTPLAFFAFQLVMAIIELMGLAWMAYRLLPPISKEQHIKWEWAPLKPVLKFSLSIAFTSSVWVLVSQIDKLILSKILPLADYGYFTVAVLVANGIMIVSSPISSAIMPRMTHLHAEGKNDELIAVYRQATQIVMVTAIPIALLLTFFAPYILWAWTGDTTLVERSAPTLKLFAIGYLFLTVNAFPYYLQYAKGDIRLHLIGNTLFLLLLVPTLIWAASKYGMIGAGWAWLTSNLIYFLIWVPMVHHKFAVGLHWKWLSRDVILIILPTYILAWGAHNFASWNENRFLLTAKLCILGILLMFTACLSSSYVRRSLINHLGLSILSWSNRWDEK